MKDKNIYKVFKKYKHYYCKICRKIIKANLSKKHFQNGINTQKRNMPNIIVSLTTFSKRIDKLDLCIKSILNQKVKPDKIIIWLGSDCTTEMAEKNLDKYKKYGVEYIIDKKNNYYSHKKYIYAFKKYQDSIIITLDDDLIYAPNLIKSLIKKYKKNPNCIIARRVHKITWNGQKICNYNEWKHEYCFIKKPSNNLFVTTGAGTLFPPNIFKECKEICEYDIIKKYAETADDVWINMMAVKHNIKIVWCGKLLQMPSEINISQQNALKECNFVQGKNDIYIDKIMKDFKISKKDFE